MKASSILVLLVFAGLCVAAYYVYRKSLRGLSSEDVANKRVFQLSGIRDRMLAKVRSMEEKSVKEPNSALGKLRRRLLVTRKKILKLLQTLLQTLTTKVHNNATLLMDLAHKPYHHLQHTATQRIESNKIKSAALKKKQLKGVESIAQELTMLQRTESALENIIGALESRTASFGAYAKPPVFDPLRDIESTEKSLFEWVNKIAPKKRASLRLFLPFFMRETFFSKWNTKIVPKNESLLIKIRSNFDTKLPVLDTQQLKYPKLQTVRDVISAHLRELVLMKAYNEYGEQIFDDPEKTKLVGEALQNDKIKRELKEKTNKIMQDMSENLGKHFKQTNWAWDSNTLETIRNEINKAKGKLDLSGYMGQSQGQSMLTSDLYKDLPEIKL